MRPVDKGNAPKVYTKYDDARHDLAGVIGYFCSYCEMAVKNMIEVEHVHPLANGGNPTAWNNFLLSCKYCNTIKGNKNQNRQGYLWPDQDNTDFAFSYSKSYVMIPRSNLPPDIKVAARRTINLMGLNRAPGMDNEPTEADTRWRSREEAWSKAKRSLKNWKSQQTKPMANAIAMTAKGGHYSIWCTVFRDHPDVIKAIRKEYKNTYTKTNRCGDRIIRPNGII